MAHTHSRPRTLAVWTLLSCHRKYPSWTCYRLYPTWSKRNKHVITIKRSTTKYIKMCGVVVGGYDGTLQKQKSHTSLRRLLQKRGPYPRLRPQQTAWTWKRAHLSSLRRFLVTTCERALFDARQTVAGWWSQRFLLLAPFRRLRQFAQISPTPPTVTPVIVSYTINWIGDVSRRASNKQRII